MVARLATVHLKHIDKDQFYNLIVSDLNGKMKGNSPTQAAYSKALESLRYFYEQFLSYFKEILIHFLEECVNYTMYPFFKLPHSHF
jgi:hypothetical protein